MTPRPIHRWKTFWLGLLVMAFLGGAWARSLRHGDYFEINLSPKLSHLHTLASGSGSISWKAESIPLGNRHGSSHLRYDTVVFDSTRDWFQSPFRYDHAEAEFGISRTHLLIAHWLITLLFLASWSSLLLWRRKKIVHLTEATSAKPSS